MRTSKCVVFALAVLMGCIASASASFPGFLKMTNGYFYDNATGQPFVPHGVAYQTWNRPLGVWETWDQLTYDLDQMVQMGANSIRADFVWQEIEQTGDNQWNWANYDYLVQQCALRNIRIFALIGYQWPPSWFPNEWYTMHPPEWDSENIYHTNRWQSDIIGYETPQARAQFSEWISNVCARYATNKTIAGWIVGNESGYLGLWSGLLDGYDTNCEAAFRVWVANKYTVAGTITTSAAPNLITNPGFETNGANWSVTGQLGIEDGFNASAAETGGYGAFVTNNSGDHYTYQDIGTNVWAPSYGTTFVYRVRARALGTITGSVKLELYHPWVATTNIDITSSLTTNWQTFSLCYNPSAGANQIIELRLHNATGGSNAGQVQFDNAYFGVTNTAVTGVAGVTGIAGADAAWGTTYTNINDLVFVPQYRAYGVEGAEWADMVQWREDSIAGFTALAAKAAKTADTNHLISYSTVGMQWGEEDWRYHAEDRGRIAAACLATNAPLDFFSVNNYPWAHMGHESQSGRWGISFTKKVAKVPVMYSETGFTSTETLWPGMNEARQAPLVRNSLWESLEDGAIGTHVFSWMDRPYITPREAGFGIVYGNRGLKQAYYTTHDAYELMDQVKIANLLAGSTDPKPDIAFLWTDAVDSQHNRYECEMQQIAGALQRLGYQPNFMNMNDLGSGAYTNYKAIVLPRNMRVETTVPNSGGKTVLDFLRTVVIPAGVHVVASADIPGIQNFNGQQRSQYVTENQQLFGIDPSDNGGYEMPAQRRLYIAYYWHPITVSFTTNAMGTVAGGYTCYPSVWKYNDEVTPSTGSVVWAYMDSGRNKGFENNNGDSNNPVAPWNYWTSSGAGLFVRTNWGWQYSGNNMLQMWGDAGVWADFDAVPFGRYTANAYLRNNSDDSFNNGAYASVSIEWYGQQGQYLGVSESPELTSNTTVAGATSAAPNLITNPGFETNGANWSVTGQLGIEDGFNASAAETGSYGAFVTNNSGDHYTYQDIGTNVWAPSYGTTFVYRVRARALGTITGSVKLELYHPWVATTNIDITSSLTTNWQTFSLCYNPSAGADQIIELRLHNATGGSNAGQVQFDNAYFGVTNTTVTAGGTGWAKYTVDTQAPSNTFSGRRIIRVGHQNLLQNGDLTGSGSTPTGWSSWNSGNTAPEYGSYLGTSGNSWTFWYDAGIYQDVTSGFSPGDTIEFGGLLYQPDWDMLRGGTKLGKVEVEFYNGSTLLNTNTALPIIDQTATNDTWLWSTSKTTVPTGCTDIRLLVRCNNFTDGSGRFDADGIYLRDDSKGGGSVYVDNVQTNPAVVVKDFGTAKAAIFLYSVGDNNPDIANGQPSTVPWQYRYDVLGSIFKTYLGIQPAISASGTNAFLCMPEYRTTTNGSVLMQIKNYLYDTNLPNGGTGLTFTVTSSLITGKTLVAFSQGTVLQTNSSGTFTITLPPDGQDIVYAYNAGTNPKQVVEISDSPSLVHPMGANSYLVTLNYDTVGLTNVNLKLAFEVNGNNGNGITNEIYAIVTNVVSGTGQAQLYIYIPDYNAADANYKSTPEGGNYQFVAWMETNGMQIVSSVPQPVQMDWGVKPTTNLPTVVNLGQSVTLPITWQNQYEYLFWQNTPMARNDSYPSRVALYRSSRTESNYPGHLAKANAVADWLESMGYRDGEPMDLMWDNVVVSNKMTSTFDSGTAPGWTREAGALNHTVEDSSLTPPFWGSLKNYDTFTTYALNATNNQLSFKVTADADNTVASFEIYASKVGVSPTYTLGCYQDAGGSPAGTPYVTQTFTVPSNTASWVSVPLPNYAWLAGYTYHFVISYASGAINSTNAAIVQYVHPACAGRDVLISTNGAQSWTSTGYEPTFRVVYYDGTYLAQPDASVSTVTINTNTYYGQVFVPGQSYKITNALVFMSKQSTANNGDLLMNIRNWTTKALLATSRVAVATVPTTNSWVQFPLPGGLQLTASNSYMFELVNLGTTGSYFAVRANALNNYGPYTWGGTNDCDLYTTTAGGSYVTEPNYDLGYQLGTVSTGMALRFWRIGNNDNILSAGTSTWSNVTASASFMYKKQGHYFNDAKLYVHYQNRDNYYMAGLHNDYGVWKIQYEVMVTGTVQQINWLHNFPTTNAPVEKTWYTLMVDSQGSTNNVYFNGQLMGTFYATNFPTGKIALGSSATQLGIWEPQKGYYFIDDDEYGQSTNLAPIANGPPLNMNYGYLVQFFNTLILPGVYVMNNAEASNLVTYSQSGMFGVLATDGGEGMTTETGSNGLGRVESVFGVSPAITTITNLSKFTVTGTNLHYVVLDYQSGSQIAITGTTAYAYSAVAGSGTALGVESNASANVPSVIVSQPSANTNAPMKVVTFNFPVDTSGQLTNGFKQVALRAFQWVRGEALKVTAELRYRSNTTNRYEDFTVYTTNVWILSGSGFTNIVLNLPTNNVMTGDNTMYWNIYMAPWDAAQPWPVDQGFYTMGNDGVTTNVSIPGVGLQVLGITDYAYHGRDWDKWIAYNTRTQLFIMTYGIKDQGLVKDDNNFSLGTNGWTLTANPNIAWSATNGALRATVNAGTTGGYAYVTRDGLALNNTNITVECDMYFGNGARDGGIIYEGRVLDINPNRIGWEDTNPNFVTSTNLYPNGTNHIVLSIRDGAPYRRSDLTVNNYVMFRNEPIESTNWTTNTVGFLSPYSNAASFIEFDNFRCVDEEYATVWTNAFGVYYPTDNIPTATWPSIPDYDPAMWEHAGTTKGAKYEWYIYFRGAGISVTKSVLVYMSPRLRVEQTNFPTVLNPGGTYGVPIEWENLGTNVPIYLDVELQEPYLGTNYGRTIFTVTNATGNGTFNITLPLSIPASTNYLWLAYLYPTYATNPILQRLGLDDTYRFTPEPFGAPVNPETTIQVTSTVASNFLVYSDAGIPQNGTIYVWAGATNTSYFNATYTNVAGIPEGSQCFQTTSTWWAGWGVFATNGYLDMHGYSNGYLKFWAKSTASLTIDLEGPQTTKYDYVIGSTTGLWQQFSIPITNWPTVNLQKMFGLVEFTDNFATTNYIDYVRWSSTP